MYFKSIKQHLTNIVIGRILDMLSINIAFYIFSRSLLLQTGDVETNPGPDLENNESQSNALSICHLHIRSIRNKIDYITTNLLDFDILCFTETHLSDNVLSCDVEIDDFVSFRKDLTSHSGGLMTYVANEFLSKRRPDLESVNIQTLWTEVKYINWTLLICNVYRPPNSLVSFWHHLNVTLEKAFEYSNKIIIVGDINED